MNESIKGVNVKRKPWFSKFWIVQKPVELPQKYQITQLFQKSTVRMDEQGYW
jgi:hypothetical protein